MKAVDPATKVYLALGDFINYLKSSITNEVILQRSSKSMARGQVWSKVYDSLLEQFITDGKLTTESVYTGKQMKLCVYKSWTP